MTTTAPPLAKELASNDKSVRDEAVDNLETFLSGDKSDQVDLFDKPIDSKEWELEWEPDTRLSKQSLPKLWKGLFYCVWMSDKPLVQQALTNKLANMVLSIRPASDRPQTPVECTRCALTFVKEFWVSMLREWTGIDRLRLDKYYLFIRRYISVSYRLLERTNWDPKAIDEYNKILRELPLKSEAAQTPVGILLHVGSVAFDELLPFIKKSSESSKQVPFIQLFEPYLVSLSKTLNKSAYNRLYEATFEPIISQLEEQVKANQDDDDLPKKKRQKRDAENMDNQQDSIDPAKIVLPENEPAKNVKDVLKALRKSFFDIGAREETGDMNRRRMYAVWKAGQDEDEDE